MINSVHLGRLSSIMEHKVPVSWPCDQAAVNYLLADCSTDVIRLSFGLIFQWEVKAHNPGSLTGSRDPGGQGHPRTRAGHGGHPTVSKELIRPSKYSHLCLVRSTSWQDTVNRTIYENEVFEMDIYERNRSKKYPGKLFQMYITARFGVAAN